VACSLSDVLRIYAPNAPYSNEQLKVRFLEDGDGQRCPLQKFALGPRRVPFCQRRVPHFVR